PARPIRRSTRPIAWASATRASIAPIAVSFRSEGAHAVITSASFSRGLPDVRSFARALCSQVVLLGVAQMQRKQTARAAARLCPGAVRSEHDPGKRLPPFGEGHAHTRSWTRVPVP